MYTNGRDYTVPKFVKANENSKFWVIKIGGDREASQVQNVLEKAAS